MSHAPKIIGLAAVLLLIQGDIGLAAKDPPPLSPRQYPPAPAQVQVPRPDLVPTMLKAWCQGNEQHVKVTAMNTGTAEAWHFKVLVRANGAVWSVPYNPYPVPGLKPGLHWHIHWVGRAPAPNPITGKVLVSVKVDSENTVVELNENNNVASVTTMPCK